VKRLFFCRILFSRHYSRLEPQSVLLMALYVGASVIIGILAVWGGMMLSNISIRG
jgi:fluoride ion exporter CrcB/FEX